MSEPIKADDMVMVVKSKGCGCNNDLGQIFVVERTETNDVTGYCSICLRETYGRMEPCAVVVVNGEEYFPAIARLKRIPPAEELGIVDERDEVPA